MSTFASGLYSQASIEFQSELLAGESLLWAGQPSRKVIFHVRDAFAIPFTLMWGGFAIFWELGVTGNLGTSFHAAPDFLALWGIPFVLIGQYMIWGRFFYTAWRKSRTHYAVTNKRVIVLNTAPRRKLTDRYFRNLESVSLTTRADGIGTIEFTPAAVRSLERTFGSWGGTSWRSNQIDIDLSSTTFFDIPDVRVVYQLIQAQREQAQSRTD